MPAAARDWFSVALDHIRVLDLENRELRRFNEERVGKCLRCTELEAENEALRQKAVELEKRLGERGVGKAEDAEETPASSGARRKRKRKKSGQRPGGQPGHPGHHRKPFPFELVTRLEPCYPERCKWCSHPLGVEHGDESPPVSHQVAELPPIRVEVTEYQLHRRRCPRCRDWTRAELPPGVPAGNFGSRLEGAVAMLSGAYHVGRRVAVRILQDLIGMRVSLGTIHGIEQRVNAAIAGACQEAVESVKQAPFVHCDETGWLHSHQKYVLWATVTSQVTVFHISPRKNAEMVLEKLGQDFRGTLISDRHSIYGGIAESQRQVCHAHLDRDFEEIAERGGASEAIGKAGMELEDDLFKHWRCFKAGEMNRTELQEAMKPVEEAMKAVLESGLTCGDAKTEGTCKSMLKLWPAFFTFTRVPGVEPTNNAAEQALRQGVIWRKLSFGTQSDAGSRYVERIMTVAETCRRQKRSILEFLAESVRAALLGQAGPSLLPNPGG